MTELALNMSDMDQPSVEEIGAARVAARQLAQIQVGRMVSFTVDKGNTADAPAEPIKVPAGIFKSIIKLLIEVGNGNAIQIVPVTAELTTQQGADLLNVSRPHFIKLLEQGEIGYRMVGTHRKVKGQCVLQYRDKVTHKRRETLSHMVGLDEDLGLYDDEPIEPREP